MIVLDTNVVSELFKPAASVAVTAWIDTQPASTLFVTAISEAELLYSVSIMAAGRRRDALRRGITTVFATVFPGRVLPFDRAAAAEYADWAAERRRSGKAAGMPDLQIAAIARARKAVAIATRNVSDFMGCGMTIINPWLM